VDSDRRNHARVIIFSECGRQEKFDRGRVEILDSLQRGHRTRAFWGHFGLLLCGRTSRIRGNRAFT